MIDRTPVVLALLDDLLRARAAERPDDRDLHALADGVALAVDHVAAADAWTSNVRLDDVWHGFGKVIVGEEPPRPGADNLQAQTAVARRLADVAASLLVRGDGLRREAEALWLAASRLLGLQATPAIATDDEVREMLAEEQRDHAEALDELSAAKAEVERLRALCAEAGRNLEVAQRDARFANETRLRRESEIFDLQPRIEDWRAWARSVDGMPTADVDDATRRDLIGSMMHDMREFNRSIEADLASMTEQRDEALRQLAELRTELAAPQKVDLRPSTKNQARVRLVAHVAPFSDSQVGMLGRVVAVNNNDGRWHVQLDTGFGAWADRSAFEVLP